jgi:hypothetical protein
MKILKSMLLGMVFSFMAAGAHAMSVTATYTGDNIVGATLCSDMSCTSGTDLGGSNLSNWKIADSSNSALGVGTYWFSWAVTNLGPPSSGNPAGLLAELTWDTMTNSSSSAWEVSLDGTSWVAATEYGSNDGSSNIWTNNNGGPIAGISGAANWLWSNVNFGSTTPDMAYFRTSITIAATLPEPGTLSLLAIGFAGIT